MISLTANVYSLELAFSYLILLALYLVCSYVLLKELKLGFTGFIPFYNLYVLYKHTRSSMILLAVNIVSVCVVLYHFLLSTLPLPVAYIAVVLSLLFILPVYNLFIRRYPKDYFLFYLASIFSLPPLFLFVLTQNLTYLFAMFYVYLIYLQGDLFFGTKEPKYFFSFLLPFIVFFFLLSSYLFNTVNIFEISSNNLLILFLIILLVLTLTRFSSIFFSNERKVHAFMNALTYVILLSVPIFMNYTF